MKFNKISNKVKAILLAGFTLVGCGRVVNPAKPGSGNFEKDPGNSSSVSDTNPDETTITEDTTTYVVEEDGTTKYYVSDEWGTSYIEPQDVVTSGLYSSSSNGRKTTKTTPVGDETTTSEYNETTKLGDETSEQQETTDNTTKNYYTTSNSKTITSKTATSKTTTNTTRGTVTTSKTTTSKTTTTTTKKNDEFKLEDVRHSIDAFMQVSSNLSNDLGKGTAFIGMPYGYTTCGYECKFLLAILVGNIDSNVLKFFFSENSQKLLDESLQFVYNVGVVQSISKNRIDYEEYMLEKDKDVAEYLNHAQDVFFEGPSAYKKFLYNEVVKGNMKEKFANDYRVMAILCGYDDSKKILKEDDITDNYMKPVLDKMYNTLYGHGYSK